MTQITVRMPDPLGPYYVRVPGPFSTPLRIAYSVVLVIAGAATGWISSQAWLGQAPPLLGTLVFVYLSLRLCGPLVYRISHDISRARMYHSIALSYLALAELQELVHGPREELGAQGL